MAFLLNWVYMTFLHTCPMSLDATRREATQKLRTQMGSTTEDADVSAFLDE
jgi:hypothetical protein